jgi:hypothetical protein
VTIEMATSATWQTETPTWENISAYVRMSDGVSYSWGRVDETQRAQPGLLSFNVNNDGRFTPGSALANSSWNFSLRTRIPIRLRRGDDVLWSGMVQSWSQAWTGGRRGVVRCVANDRVAWAQRVPANDLVQAEYLALVPDAYYPLDEASSATSFRDLTGGAALEREQIGAGGNATSGYNCEVTDYSHITSVDFTPASAGNGVVLKADRRFTGPIALSAMVNPSSTSGTYIAAHLGVANSLTYMGIGVDDGKPFGYVSWNGEIWTVTASNSIGNTSGDLHHVAFIPVEHTTPGEWYAVLVVDGAIDGIWWPPSTIGALNFDELYIGGAPGETFDGRVAHVSVGGDFIGTGMDPVYERFDGAAQQWEAESSDARFNRICRTAGLGDSWFSSETGTADMGVQTSSAAQSIWSALEIPEAAELGQVFAGPDGVLTFHTRAHRYNAGAAFSLSASDLDSDFVVTTDDAYLVNVVDATIVNGPVSSSYRATDRSSVIYFGPYQESATFCVSSTSAGERLARSRATISGTIYPRASTLSVDLVAKADAVDVDTIVTATMGDLIEVTGLPTSTGAPDSEMQFFLEGVSGVITDRSWRWTASVSPASSSFAWILGDSTYSVLGSTTRLALPGGDGGGVG